MSVHSWGERPNGTWQLEIHNDGHLLGKSTLTLYASSLFKCFEGTKYKCLSMYQY